MPKLQKRKRKVYKTGTEKLDQKIAELVETAGGSPDHRYLRELIVTAIRLHVDQVEPVDMRLMNAAFKELWYSFKVFSPYRHIRKVALFGSARTPRRSIEYQQAKKFARGIVDKGWMVITGASSGIMSAGNEGAGRAHSFGVNIRLPFETDSNPSIRGDLKLINFKYFFTRKLMFIRESDATVLCPGGYGTHDEGFETLTLVQTGKADPRPVICLDAPGSNYWSTWKRFIVGQLQKKGMTDPEDLAWVHFTHDPADAVRVVERFYHNYHSLRYIRDLLVIRLKRPLAKSLLRDLNRRFRMLIVKGKIEQKPSPFPEEDNEPHTLDLTRLYLYFDRRHHAHLKMLIDEVNRV